MLVSKPSPASVFAGAIMVSGCVLVMVTIELTRKIQMLEESAFVGLPYYYMITAVTQISVVQCLMARNHLRCT